MCIERGCVQSVDCLRKTGETLNALKRHPVFSKVIYNTGAILEEPLFDILRLRKLVWVRLLALILLQRSVSV